MSVTSTNYVAHKLNEPTLHQFLSEEEIERLLIVSGHWLKRGVGVRLLLGILVLPSVLNQVAIAKCKMTEARGRADAFPQGLYRTG